MLAKSNLCHTVFALAKHCQKKQPGEKKLGQLKHRMDCPMRNEAVLVCVSRMWMAQSPPVSYLGKEIPSAYSYGMTM
jgi:hypothetical protein